MYLIAEIGFNHEGDIPLGKKMIKEAADAGANAVKFQTFSASDIALPSSPHFELIKKGEMSYENHLELKKVADRYHIDFLSTPFGIDKVDLLSKLGVSAYKIASMDCTNHPLLQQVGQKKKPVYLSTGMASEEEIEAAIKVLKQHNCDQIVLLHCISYYPPKAEELNLKVIPYLRERFHLPVGYSDHFPGIDACLAAFFLGAEVIETHFTLDKSTPGGDHAHSADPEDLRQLVQQVGQFNTMAGSGEMSILRPDRDCAKDVRRGVYTNKLLHKDHILTEQDLKFTRPTSEFTPNDIDFLTGKKLKVDLPADTPITKSVISSG